MNIRESNSELVEKIEKLKRQRTAIEVVKSLKDVESGRR